jgi:hypothetical protein
MVTDLTALDPTTATPLELLLLADEAERQGARWEEIAWLRLRALDCGDRSRPGSLPVWAQWGYWGRRTLLVAGPDWEWRSEVGWRTWHGAEAYRDTAQPPPQVRRLVEAAAAVAVRRVLAAAVGVTGAGPGA